MSVQMDPVQLAFWRELLAPFEDHQLSTTSRGGKKLTYVDKRSITNRLDSVCGPHGWYPEYEATARGYKCRLYIEVPLRQGWGWMHKEDGAGFEEMGSTNKTTGEFEYDVDNDEKSGYTNALRRAAQDAWGIGRYLYQKGIPTFLDRDLVHLHTTGFADKTVQPAPSKLATLLTDSRPVAKSEPSAPPAELRDPVTPPKNTREPAPPPKAGEKVYDNFKIPKPGKSIYPWAKEMEKVFETSLIGGMQQKGESEGWGKNFAEWNEEQVRVVCTDAIRHIRELPSYGGQYEFLFPAGQSDPSQVNPAVRPGINIADLRKLLMARMSALITKHTGNAATNPELKSALGTISASAKTRGGHAGLVCESLARCDDEVWVQNMIQYVDAKISEEVSASLGELSDPEIPF